MDAGRSAASRGNGLRDYRDADTATDHSAYRLETAQAYAVVRIRLCDPSAQRKLMVCVRNLEALRNHSQPMVQRLRSGAVEGRM
jgi:hypothetical protein